MPTRVVLDESALERDPLVKRNVLKIARSIAKMANQTTAPIGIVARRVDDLTVRIGPRGAPAIALEFGTRFQPAKRYVKRALDRHRIS